MTALKLTALASLISVVLLSGRSEGLSFQVTCKAPVLMAKMKSLESKVGKLLTMVAKLKGNY